MSDVDVVALLDVLRSRGATVALAESLTGGLLTDALVGVAGASDVVRGGVVAYAADLKASLLGVGTAHLERHGTVDAGTAAQMADGARARLGATVGLSTTGVAGPGPSEDRPAGTAFVALAAAGTTRTEELHLDGDRTAVRRGTVQAALRLLERWAEETTRAGERKNSGGAGVGVG